MTIAERIAGLPVAVNTAKPFQAQLTQARPGSERPIAAAGNSGPSATESYVVMKSLYAADRSGYTKADAVNKQWKKMNTVNILDVLNGTADTSNRTLSAKDVEERLREGNLLDEVSDLDLRMLQFELSGLQFETGAAYPSVEPGELYKNVEYLASRYAAMEDKIKTTYTGAEQKERLNRLDEMYGETLERTAKSYSEIVGGILEGCGVSGEKEKICQSFKSGVEQKVAKYREFLEQNRGSTGLEGTEDAWLLKDDEYIAAMLRGGRTSVSERTPAKDGEYSLQELDTLGRYASSLSVMSAKTDPYKMSEEQMGLDLAMLAMKTDTLSKGKDVSPALSATLQKTLNGYLNVFLEQYDRKLEMNRKNARIAADLQGNAEIDKDSVRRVYQRTMEEYRRSGNAVDALIKGAEYGRSQYAQKMNSGYTKEIYRYKNSGFYWIDFFGNPSEKKAGYYGKTESAYEQYVMGWLDFKCSLEDGNGVRMNLSLRSVASYSADQSGNWISELA